MTTFETWQDGDLTDTQALRALCRDLGAVESQLAPLEVEKKTLRDQIGQIVARLDGQKTTITGVGTLRITASSIRRELLVASTALTQRGDCRL